MNELRYAICKIYKMPSRNLSWVPTWDQALSQGLSQISAHLLFSIFLRDEKVHFYYHIFTDEKNKPRKFMQFFQGCAIKEWQDRDLSLDCLVPGKRYYCVLTCMLDFREKRLELRSLSLGSMVHQRCNAFILRECLGLHTHFLIVERRNTLFKKKKNRRKHLQTVNCRKTWRQQLPWAPMITLQG